MPATNRSVQYGSSQSQQRTAIVPGMRKVYNQLLAENTANYNNVLKAYGEGQQQLSRQLGGIYAGYGNVENQVMHTLGVDGGGWGVATPAAQAIQQQFAKNQGQTQQDLINRGLGNSTVLSGASTANTLAAGQAMGGLGAQLAQTAAGYQSQIGMADLGAQMQGAGMQANFAQSYMGDLSRYEFRNTAGNLTGGFGSSSSMQNGNSDGQSFESPMMGGRGGGMGHIGEPNFGGGGGLASSYGGDQGDPWGDASRAAQARVGGLGGGLPQVDVSNLSANYAGSYGQDFGGGTYGGYAGSVA